MINNRTCYEICRYKWKWRFLCWRRRSWRRGPRSLRGLRVIERSPLRYFNLLSYSHQISVYMLLCAVWKMMRCIVAPVLLVPMGTRWWLTQYLILVIVSCSFALIWILKIWWLGCVFAFFTYLIKLNNVRRIWLFNSPQTRLVSSDTLWWFTDRLSDTHSDIAFTSVLKSNKEFISLSFFETISNLLMSWLTVYCHKMVMLMELFSDRNTVWNHDFSDYMHLVLSF